MIISGLRTSWAMTVERRPSDDSRSFCDISRWNRAIEIGQGVERRGEQTGVFVSHRPPLTDGDFPGQIAGGRHLAHHVGDVGQRPRDRPRHGEAQKRREQHGDDRRYCEPGVNGPQARAGARSATAGSTPPGRSPSAASPSVGAAAAAARGNLLRRRRSRDMPERPQSPPSAGYDLLRQRGRQNLTVHAERDIAAGDLLQLRGQRVVEQEPDAERSEDVRLRQTDENRDRHQLQHAGRLRQQAEAFLPAEGIAHRRLAGDDECRLRGRRPTVASTRAGLVGDEQEVRLQLILIAAGDVLDRRRIVGVAPPLSAWARRR